MALPNPSPGDTVAAAHIDSIRTHLEGGAGDTAPYKLRQSAGDFIVVLADAAGASALSIHDSADVEVASIDSDGLATITSLSITNLDLPVSASPSQTADGRIVWDSDDDVITVGDGTSRKTFYPERHVVIRKAANESVTSSTVFQDDDDFLLTVANGDTWDVEMILSHTAAADAGTNQGTKFCFTFPSTSLAVGTAHHASDNVVNSPTQATTLTSGTQFFSTSPGNASAQNVVSRVTARFTFTAGGTLRLQWAQVTSLSNASTVKANSIAHFWKVA